jgi:hypothetical protein
VPLGELESFAPIMNRHTPKDENCPKCGAEVTYWYPNNIEFADLSTKIAATTTLARFEGNPQEPQHPGRYCSKGCFAQMFKMDSRAFWERLERERSERETSSLLVRLTTPQKLSLN